LWNLNLGQISKYLLEKEFSKDVYHLRQIEQLFRITFKLVIKLAWFKKQRRKANPTFKTHQNAR